MTKLPLKTAHQTDRMPREIITLQLGQCGNQSKSSIPADIEKRNKSFSLSDIEVNSMKCKQMKQLQSEIKS